MVVEVIGGGMDKSKAMKAKKVAYTKLVECID